MISCKHDLLFFYVKHRIARRMSRYINGFQIILSHMEMLSIMNCRKTGIYCFHRTLSGWIVIFMLCYQLRRISLCQIVLVHPRVNISLADAALIIQVSRIHVDVSFFSHKFCGQSRMIRMQVSQ